MSFGLRMNGHPAAEIRTNGWRRRAGSSGSRTTSGASRRLFPGGQRQRVAIGRAIVRGPEVFLFDEPLSNLDAELRVEMRVEIARLHQEIGATMIYVTHDQVEAMTLADKIVVLRDGRIEQTGAPMDLYRDPDNRFVAGFIGSPAMNFLDGNGRGRRGGGPRAPGESGTLRGPPAGRNRRDSSDLRPEHLSDRPRRRHPSGGACRGPGRCLVRLSRLGDRRAGHRRGARRGSRVGGGDGRHRLRPADPSPLRRGVRPPNPLKPRLPGSGTAPRSIRSAPGRFAFPPAAGPGRGASPAPHPAPADPAEEGRSGPRFTSPPPSE